MTTIGTGGADIVAVKTGTVTFDAASVAAATSAAQAITITGVAVGDMVQVVPNADLSVAVTVGATYVTATDTVKVFFINPTAGPLDPASATYRYIWFDLT